MKAHEAWKLIGEMNWGMSSNSCVMAKKWYREIGPRKMTELHKFVALRAEELYAAVQRHESETGDTLEVGSDDGFSDLRYHIVGQGLEVFEANLENPILMAERCKMGEYKESFDYVFFKPTVIVPTGKKAFKKAVDGLEGKLQAVTDYVEAIDMKLNSIRKLLDELEESRRLMSKYEKEQSEKPKKTA